MSDDVGELACFGGRPVMGTADLTEAPLLDEQDASDLAELVRSRNIEPVNGPHGTALRSEWPVAVGGRHCQLAQSGMAALQAALVAEGIGAGDDVLVPALTFTATAAAVLRVGASPVFVDCDPRTRNIDVADAARKVTGRTRAMIVVHCHGLPADLPSAARLAGSAGLALIGDGAQAPGATIDGVPVGDLATTTWSHSRGKPVMAGGGGSVTTTDAETFDRLQLFAQQGEQRPTVVGRDSHRGYFCRVTPCDNLRMAEPTAALVRGQLRRLPRYLETARRHAGRLTAALRDIPGVTPPHVPVGYDSTWTYFRFDVDVRARAGQPSTQPRDNIYWALRAEGVPVSTWLLYGLDRLPGFRRSTRDGALLPVDPGACPIVQEILDTTLVLGSAPHMLQVQSPRSIELMVDAFEKVFTPRHLSRVLAAEHRPLDVVPPIPGPIDHATRVPV